MYTNPLKNKLYGVRIPMIATYSEEELELFGVPIDIDDDKPDHNTYNNLVQCEITIDAMINHHLNGYPIRITNPDDSKEIYKILEEYLNIQKNKIHSSVNSGYAQDSRLKDIDNFLTDIFNNNKNLIVRSLVSASNGYAIDMGLMGTQRSVIDNNRQTHNGPTGIMAGYSDNNQQQQSIPQTPYIQPNQVNINIDDIRRKATVRTGSSITAGYLNDDNI